MENLEVKEDRPFPIILDNFNKAYENFIYMKHHSVKHSLIRCNFNFAFCYSQNCILTKVSFFYNTLLVLDLYRASIFNLI